jgi:aubergine-like protein
MSAVAMKVAVQMATKLGAEPWGVTIPLQDTMVVGIDTSHDTLNKRKSVGAVVFTMNKNMTRYKSVTAMHENNDELHTQLLAAFRDALDT